MSLIYDWQGNKHDLTVGAFDSLSRTNPDQASIYLYLGLGSIEDGSTPNLFKQLSQKYLSKQKSSYATNLWTRFKQQLPQLRSIGGTLGTSLLMGKVKTLAGANPVVLGALTAAELVLGQVFSLSTAKRTFTEPLPGQWVFIESDKSYRRRLGAISESKHMIKANIHGPEPTSISKASDNWRLGFFVRESVKYGHMVVFDCNKCKETDLKVARLMNVPPELAEQLDGQEELSAIREIYFIKETRDKKSTKTNNFWPGRLVSRGGTKYRVVAASEVNVVAIDAKGGIHTIPKRELQEEGDSVSKPGVFDNYFEKSGKSQLYRGMWAWVPARADIKETLPADYELVCVGTLGNRNDVAVYHIIGGEGKTYSESEGVPVTPEEMSSFNLANDSKRFRVPIMGGFPNAIVKTFAPLSGFSRYVTMGSMRTDTTPEIPDAEPVDPIQTQTIEKREPKYTDPLHVEPVEKHKEQPKEEKPPEPRYDGEEGNGMVMVMVGIMAYLFISQFAGGVNIPL